MKNQGGGKFSWELINGEAQITAGRVENFLKINKRVYPFIWDLRVPKEVNWSLRIGVMGRCHFFPVEQYQSRSKYFRAFGMADYLESPQNHREKDSLPQKSLL